MKEDLKNTFRHCITQIGIIADGNIRIRNEKIFKHLLNSIYCLVTHNGKSYGEVMKFMNAYKRLEKLCSDMYGTAHGISAYIDDMVNCPCGARVVPDWAHDLKQLKHYRWIRNQIVHEPDCTEEELCTPADTQWLDAFYDRILRRKDPLAVYRERTGARKAVSSAQGGTPSKRKSRPAGSSHLSPIILYGGITISLILIMLAILLFIFQGSLTGF